MESARRANRRGESLMTKCVECDGEWFELLDHAEALEECGCGIQVCMNCGAEYERDGEQLSM